MIRAKDNAGHVAPISNIAAANMVYQEPLQNGLSSGVIAGIIGGTLGGVLIICLTAIVIVMMKVKAKMKVKDGEFKVYNDNYLTKVSN